jgi:signal transduction histidine kinase
MFMTYYIISSFINASIGWLFGLFILIKRKKTRLNINLALWCFSIASWSLFYLIWQIETQAEMALLWTRMLMIGAIWVPVSYLRVVVTFLELENEKKRFLRINYVLGLFFTLLLSTPLMVDHVEPLAGFSFWPKPGIMYHPFLLMFVYLSLYSAWLSFKALKTEPSKIKRLQIKYMLFGVAISIAGGSTNYFLWYDIPIKPYGNIFASTYVITTVYAMIRYRLMDIRIIIRKIITYFIIILILAIPFVLEKYLDNNAQFFKINHASIEIFFLIVLVIFIPVLYDRIQKFVNARVYAEVYSTKDALTKFAQRINNNIRLDDIVKLSIENLVENFGLDRATVLLHEDSYHRYNPYTPIGQNQVANISLTCDSELVKYLKTEKKLIIHDELELQSRDTTNSGHKENLNTLKNEMTKISSSLCLPLIRHEEITGVIVLGNKLSNEPYSQDDIDLLMIIGEQTAIAIENSLLYNQMERIVAKQTKKLSTQNKKLEELLESKSTFLSVASHQLRTPTSIIRGMLSMLQEGSVPPEKKSYFIDRAVAGADRLSQTIRDLLSATSLETVGFKFDKRPTQIEDIIKKIINERAPKLEEKNIKLIYKSSKKLAPLVSVDSNKIIEVVSNLIDNSIQYTPSGSITIETKSDKNRFYFSIKDTGIGIPAEELKNIFTKMYRTPNAITTRPDGTGLGLFLVKKIIEGHKGKAEVTSAGIGKGSTISFWLPIG